MLLDEPQKKTTNLSRLLHQLLWKSLLEVRHADV
jgi:hypothetical protein